MIAVCCFRICSFSSCRNICSIIGILKYFWSCPYLIICLLCEFWFRYCLFYCVFLWYGCHLITKGLVLILDVHIRYIRLTSSSDVLYVGRLLDTVRHMKQCSMTPYINFLQNRFVKYVWETGIVTWEERRGKEEERRRNESWCPETRRDEKEKGLESIVQPKHGHL